MATNPLIQKYLQEKFGADFETQKQQEYNDSLDSSNLGFLGSNLGNVIAGNKVGSNSKFFEKRNEQAKENTIGAIENAKKEFASDYDIDQKIKTNEISAAQVAKDNDPNSDESKIYQGLAIKMGMNPEQAKNLTASKAKSISPVLEKMYAIDQNRINRQDSLNAASKYRQESKDIKAHELNAAQSKSVGLYKSGKLAEDQYNSASTTNEFDPTSSGQWIDNSSWAPNWMKNNKAIESQSAKDSWIENFLRDASGAAIAPSERSAYAEIYFPAPGDTDSIVLNKQNLRNQKMQSAAAAAGPKAQSNINEFDNMDYSPTQEQAMAELAKRRNSAGK